jgi:hypothetical protein
MAHFVKMKVLLIHLLGLYPSVQAFLPFLSRSNSCSKPIVGFVQSPSHVSLAHEHKHVVLSMSMRPAYDNLCATVSSKFSLKVTDFAQAYQAQSWRGSSAEGTAEWLAEASPQFLTGVSTCTRNNYYSGHKKEELMLNIWMGPSYDIPHCLLTFGEGENGLYHVTADYVPRGATVMGGDPQYMERYYGGDVQSAWTAAYQQGVALPPEMEFESRLLDSPARISVTGLSQQQAQDLAINHVNRFLSWVDAAQPIPARLRGSFNMRDDKLRQFYYRGQVQKQLQQLGDGLGQTVAIANTGPTAEAYVGGGS